MNTKIDRRKKYTRMVLKDSLIQLLRKKHISNITVKEICELADINRSTFYSHYANQFDLLHSIEEEFIKDMVSTLSQYNFSKNDESFKMTEKVLEYIANNRDICEILLSENSDIQFLKKGMEITNTYIFKKWIENSQLDKKTVEYINIFVISGCIYVIKNWLESGMNITPAQLAEIIHQFVNNGLSTLK